MITRAHGYWEAVLVTSEGVMAPESLESIVGYPPDLIAAAAANGQEGYLRRSELAEYLSSDSPQDNSLPVYDLDGNVIGEFIFGNG